MLKKSIMSISKKIFLVDDDLFSLNNTRSCLDQLGYKDVSLYLNGIICLNNLHLKPSIIFLDITINELVKYEILKKIKQYNPNIYVVIISKIENNQIAIDAIRHGAFDYFVKKDDEITKMKNVIERIHKSKL
jgi:polysaccharide export outer membrane protein